ncbi:helix-turn-helix domain-containing protein [Paracoccus homiensis]
MHGDQRHRSSRRAPSILKAFSIRSPSLTLAELARESGLPKSMIRR